MRRVSAALAMLVGLFASFVDAPAARSAGGGTILASGTFSLTVTHQAFRSSSCSRTVVDTPGLNGYDAKIVDISPDANRMVTFSWSGVSPIGAVTISIYDGGAPCRLMGNTMTVNSPSISLFIPPGAKWMVVEAQNTANVTFSYG